MRLGLFLTMGSLTSVFVTLGTGCSITATRPVQEMSYTVAAIRAAKEVQADTLAPELYRQARDWFFQARRDYKFKNFEDARIAAKKARIFAERAEFEALANGGFRRADVSDSDAAAVYGQPKTPSESRDAGYAEPPTQYFEEFEEEKAPKKPTP